MSIPSMLLSLSQISRISRPGCCSAIAAIASSEFPARRVVKPSSCRISEISSRISRSSSTIKISLIPPSYSLFLFGFEIFRRAQRQAQNGHGARARARAECRRILKRQRATMFLDDLLDDRQAQPGALFACCHVGLEEARAILWQAHAIVGDADHGH